MNLRKGCAGRVHGDSIHCDRCGYVWDTNDAEPPKCKTEAETYVQKQQLYGRQRIRKLKEQLSEALRSSK